MVDQARLEALPTASRRILTSATRHPVTSYVRSARAVLVVFAAFFVGATAFAAPTASPAPAVVAEVGGCSSAGGAALGVLGLCILLARRRDD